MGRKESNQTNNTNKMYMLLYVDNNVIFANSAEELKSDSTFIRYIYI